MRFEIQILGANASQPFRDRRLPAQILYASNHIYLVDCGEGTQVQMMKYKVKRNRIRAIFISHLHGDHFFGLPGLITSYSHFHRTQPLHVFGPPGLKDLLDQIFKISQVHLDFELSIEEFSKDSGKIYEDDATTVTTFPLIHRIPAWGFRITEKERPRKIRVEEMERHGIPIRYYSSIKKGEDYVSPEGRRIHNVELTMDPPVPRSYAYCSDTAYSEAYFPFIQNTDLLYHEATFDNARAELAKLTGHSTAAQAATVAKMCGAKRLIIGHYSSRFEELDGLLREARNIFPKTDVAVEGEMYSI